MTKAGSNLDRDTVAGFGREWSKFRQREEFSEADRAELFARYFELFPWSDLPPQAVGIDIGCGSGRWALLVAPRVQHLHLLDASAAALAVAKENLNDAANVSFHLASVEAIPLPDRSLDFAYSLGVLHHIPDTARGIGDIARKLKPGAPFLVYLYYAFDNRPAWFRTVWRMSDVVRRVVSRMPERLHFAVTQAIAAIVYWPLARTAKWLERIGWLPATWPLSYYRNRSFYVMRTDAYDRFCTPLEHRFTRVQIEAMLRGAGFSRIRFLEAEPYWCAVAVRD
jgi:ubiquinone/menaquinone biosynthesis C-methylase UbiE